MNARDEAQKIYDDLFTDPDAALLSCPLVTYNMAAIQAVWLPDDDPRWHLAVAYHSTTPTYPLRTDWDDMRRVLRDGRSDFAGTITALCDIVKSAIARDPDDARELLRAFRRAVASAETLASFYMDPALWAQTVESACAAVPGDAAAHPAAQMLEVLAAVFCHDLPMTRILADTYDVEITRDRFLLTWADDKSFEGMPVAFDYGDLLSNMPVGPRLERIREKLYDAAVRTIVTTQRLEAPGR